MYYIVATSNFFAYLAKGLFLDFFSGTHVHFWKIGNLRTPTTTLLTKTGSELQCTAQARPVNFVVVVSSTTPNKVGSRRPAIHKLLQIALAKYIY